MAIFNASVVPSSGGGTEYEEGKYTPTAEKSSSLTIPFSNSHSEPPAIVIVTLTNEGTVTSTSSMFYRFAYERYDRLLGKGMAQSASIFSIYGAHSENGQSYNSSGSITTVTDSYATETGFTIPLTSSWRLLTNNVYAWCAYWGEH